MREKVFWNQSNSRCRHHQRHPAKVGTGNGELRSSLRSQFVTLEKAKRNEKLFEVAICDLRKNANSLNYSGISCEMQVSIGKGFTT